MKVLLVDGDWLCYSIACAAENPNPFDIEQRFFDSFSARQVLKLKINEALSDLNCKKAIFYFSCKRSDNWRKLLLPSYKENRAGVIPPIGLEEMRSYSKENYDFFEEDRLEADDLIGIDATGHYAGKSIIYSIDKDFLTLPCTTYNPNKNVIKRQTRKGAIMCFIYQTIIGDSSDGYKGLNRIGPKKAEAFLEEHSDNIPNIWEPLCELAVKQGHDESYLLLQARMAHILQTGDYDKTKREIKLWNPEELSCIDKITD